MTEQWLPIPGEDGYDVSDRGRVRCWWVHWSNPRRLASEPKLLAQSTQREVLAEAYGLLSRMAVGS
jgi:hypothetical protein